MAGFINVTNRFTNQDKRESEAVVVTCPAMIEEGGQRTGTPPTYVGSGDALTAAVIEPDTVVQNVYLIVDEPFPAGTTASVDIAGTTFFADVAVDAKGLTVSTQTDKFFENGQTVTVGFVNGAVDTPIEEGVLRVVIDTLHPSLKNGNYAAH